MSTILCTFPSRSGYNAVYPALQTALGEGHHIVAYFTDEFARLIECDQYKIDPQITIKLRNTRRNCFYAFLNTKRHLTITVGSTSIEGARTAARTAWNSEPPMLAIENINGNMTKALNTLKSHIPTEKDSENVQERITKLCVADKIGHDLAVKTGYPSERITITNNNTDRFWEEIQKLLKT